MNTFSYKIKEIVAYAAICIIWGTTYFAIMTGLKEGFQPFIMGSTRFVIAAFIFLFIGLLTKRMNFNLKFIFQNMLLGIVMMGGGQGLIFWAQQYISSGYAAILEASLPLWFVVLDGANRGQYLKNNKIIGGLILGFIGIVLLFFKEMGHFSSSQSVNTLYGASAVIASCICWVAASLYYARHFRNSALISGLSWQLIGGTFCCIIIAGLTGEFSVAHIFPASQKAWLSVIYLAIAGSVCAFLSYHWLLRQWPSAVVGTYAYINPVIAVLLGYFAASEKIVMNQLIGMGFILIAAFIVNKNR